MASAVRVSWNILIKIKQKKFHHDKTLSFNSCKIAWQKYSNITLLLVYSNGPNLVAPI
jgi:hypothetical protein